MKNQRPVFNPNELDVINLLSAAHAKCYDGQLADIRWYANKLAMKPFDPVGIDFAAEPEKKVKHKIFKHAFKAWWGLGK